MENIFFIMLLLLSLAGYCTGAVSKAGKSIELKPQIIDLIIILSIWAGAIYSRLVLDYNNWFIILVWVVLSVLIGILSIWPRNLSEEKFSKIDEPPRRGNGLLRMWRVWSSFTKRMGGFQSRIVLSIFYFTVVSLFALPVKLFSDPLGIKRQQHNESNWHFKTTTGSSIEELREQF